MFYPDFIVVFIVCRCNLQYSCSKFTIDIVIGNDRHRSIQQRNQYPFSMKVLIAFIFRVHANCCITEDRFRSGCGDGKPLIPIQCHSVPHIIQLRFYLPVNHLLIRYSRFSTGIPVDHPNTPVNIPFPVQIDKYPDDTFRKIIIHGEFCAIPITGCTKLLQLFKNDPAVLVSPFPGIFQKFLPCYTRFVNTFLLQMGNNPCFSSNGSMIGTG